MHKTLFFLIFLFLSVHIYAQKHKQDTTNNIKLNTSVSAGYIIGAQVYNDNFLYNPGWMYSIETYIPFSSDLNVGGGISFLQLQNERFIPVYIDLISYRDKKKTSHYIHARCGYSYGWNTSIAPMDDYTFNGGTFLSIGTGKKIHINKSFSMMIEWAYMHQFAKMTYTIYSSQTYNEVLNYDMFNVSLSLIMH
ncbi:MAG: hypothetical protein R6U95_03120 [Bacteroidales bacterium]